MYGWNKLLSNRMLRYLYLECFNDHLYENSKIYRLFLIKRFKWTLMFVNLNWKLINTYVSEVLKISIPTNQSDLLKRYQILLYLITAGNQLSGCLFIAVQIITSQLSFWPTAKFYTEVSLINCFFVFYTIMWPNQSWSRLPAKKNSISIYGINFYVKYLKCF